MNFLRNARDRTNQDEEFEQNHRGKQPYGQVQQYRVKPAQKGNPFGSNIQSGPIDKRNYQK